jgi:hypothetical protein
MPLALRVTAFLAFFLLGGIAGWLVGRRLSRPIGPRARALCWTLYGLWCASWLPSLVGALSESTEPDTPTWSAVRAVCAANALLYYVGGGAFLAALSRGHSIWVVVLAWVPCFFLNSFGPITLLPAGLLLHRFQEPRLRADPAGR